MPSETTQTSVDRNDREETLAASSRTATARRYRKDPASPDPSSETPDPAESGDRSHRIYLGCLAYYILLFGILTLLGVLWERKTGDDAGAVQLRDSPARVAPPEGVSRSQ